MRIILFTGKGGVGKTTCAAATALASAAAGHRTAVISTDPAHSLADAFDVPLGDDLTEVAPRCWARQLDAQRRMEDSWGELRVYLRSVLDRSGLDGIEAEELSVVPGIDEVFALADIKSFAEEGGWGVLVVDCAPTAETIRLLSLPDILSWYMDRLFPIGRRLNRAVGPLVAKLSHLPAASDEVFGAAASFYDRLDGVRELLVAPSCSIRMVLTPERMVVAEARRTYTYLSLFGYRVDAVVANRLLPDEVVDPWFDTWRREQRATLAEITADVDPVPVLPAPLAEREVIGVPLLRDFGERLYAGLDPVGVLHDGVPMRFDLDGDRAELSIHLPLADRPEIDLRRSADDLIITVGQYRRVVALPESLKRRQVASARFRGEHLDVEFESIGGTR